MAPEEPGLDIAGPTAESDWALYPPPSTIISQRTSAGFSRYIYFRWLNSPLAIGIAGIELDPVGPSSALSVEPSVHARRRPGPAERMA